MSKTGHGGNAPLREDSAQTALERRTKALFDDSVRGLDGATRARLAQARTRALEELAPRARPFGDWRLAAVGALAAFALALYLVPWRAEPPEPLSMPMQAGVLDDLELLLTEDIEMFEADLEFYAWLEEQPELEAPPAADGDGVG